MLFQIVSFLVIVVQFGQVLSIDVALTVNGSLTIFNFGKMCETSGFTIGDPMKIEGSNLTTSFTVTTHETDSFGLILEALCPYVGYYPMNETSKLDSTSPTITDERDKESSKVKNISEPFLNETRPTIKPSASTNNNTISTEVKPDILRLLDITTNTTTEMIKTKPTIENKATTLYEIPDKSFTIQNVTEPTTSEIELASDDVVKNKNVTSTVLPIDSAVKDKNVTSTSPELPIDSAIKDKNVTSTSAELLSDSVEKDKFNTSTTIKLPSNSAEKDKYDTSTLTELLIDSAVKHKNVTLTLTELPSDSAEKDKYDTPTPTELLIYSTVKDKNVSSTSTELPIDSADKDKNVTLTSNELPSYSTDKDKYDPSTTELSIYSAVKDNNVTYLSALPIENVAENKNITSTLTESDNKVTSTSTPVLPTILTTEASADNESTTERSGNIVKMILFIKSTTDPSSPKINADIIDTNEVVSTAKNTKKADAFSDHSESKSYSSFHRYFEDKRSTIKLWPKILSTESTSVLLSDEIDYLDLANIYDYIDSTIHVIKSSSDYKTDGIDETKFSTHHDDHIVKTIFRSDYETDNDDMKETKSSTHDQTDDDNDVDDDYDTNDDDLDETKKLSNINSNGTIIYRHNPKSVDEKRVVIVILFISILLALIVIWTSKMLYRKQKGEYVLPQNMDHENIEL